MSCIEWDGYRGPRGYGRRWFDGAYISAHRAAWIEINGPIPDGMYVCHKCDNPPCVNAGHLFLGTQLDNMRDMWSKGRGPKQDGEHNGNHRLSAATIREIRAQYASGGCTWRSLGAKYGVTHRSIGHIVSGKQWRAS